MGRMHRKIIDGIYELDCRATETGEQVAARAIVRQKVIVGAGAGGGTFHGRVARNGDSKCVSITGLLNIPPHGTLITDDIAGPNGLQLPFNASGSDTCLVAVIAGCQVSVNVRYVAPLPKELKAT